MCRWCVRPSASSSMPTAAPTGRVTSRRSRATCEPSAKRDDLVLGDQDRGRHRHPARRGLQDRRDAVEGRVGAGLAVDLQELRGHRSLLLAQRAARRHHQLHRLRRRAAGRPVGAEGAARRCAGEGSRSTAISATAPRSRWKARSPPTRCRCARPCAGPASSRCRAAGSAASRSRRRPTWSAAPSVSPASISSSTAMPAKACCRSPTTDGRRCKGRSPPKGSI